MRKLFKWGNYMRKYGICTLLICDHLVSSLYHARQLSQLKKHRAMIKLITMLYWSQSNISLQGPVIESLVETWLPRRGDWHLEAQVSWYWLLEDCLSPGPKGGKHILAWKQSPVTLRTHWADITAKWAGTLRWLSNDNDPLGAGKETSLADDGVSFFSGKMGAIITLLVAMSYKWPLRSLQTRWRVAQKDLCRSALSQ